MTNTVFDWNELGIGDAEDPKEVAARLEKIHRDMLAAQGIDYKPEKNSPGFRPTAEQARQVAVMSCLGIDPKDIALVLNIELKLLKLYYDKELHVSKNLANAMVARVALRMAMSGASADMTKFWLKTQAGWKETTGIDITSKGDKLEGMTSKDKVRAALASASKTNKKAEPPSPANSDE